MIGRRVLKLGEYATIFCSNSFFGIAFCVACLRKSIDNCTSGTGSQQIPGKENGD